MELKVAREERHSLQVFIYERARFAEKKKWNGELDCPSSGVKYVRIASKILKANPKMGEGGGGGGLEPSELDPFQQTHNVDGTGEGTLYQHGE